MSIMPFPPKVSASRRCGCGTLGSAIQRMENCRSFAVAVLLMTVATVAAPATTPSPELPEVIEELEEVEVQGTPLFAMRKAIVEAEDRFFARYNELNQKDEFDIVCRQEQRLGTRISRRVCVPQLVDDATAAEAVGVMDAMLAGKSLGEALQSPRSELAVNVLTNRNAEYRDNMLRLLRNDRELRALVQEQKKMQDRYDKAHKERLRGRILLVE